MLTPQERATLRKLLDEQAADVVELTTGQGAEAVERAVCLSALRLLEPEAPDGAAAMFVAALAAQGPGAADLLAAIVALAPRPVAAAAARALDRSGIRGAAWPLPRVTEALALRLPGADVYLLRAERDAPAWHAAHLIIEGEGPSSILATASIAMAEDGGDLADGTAELDPSGIAAIEPAELTEVQERLRVAVGNARRDGAGLGVSTTTCLPLIGAALGVAAEEVCGLSPGGGPSSLVVGPDEEARFEEVADQLLDELEVWLDETERPIRPGLMMAEVMLSFKWLEDDGDLARWTEEDLAQLLLDFVPREVFVDDRTLALIPDAVEDILLFLADRKLLAGAPVPELLTTCAELRDPLAAAVAEAPDRGPADRLMRAMVADGVDLSDEAAVQAWIAAYNAGTQAEREAITGPPSRPARAKAKRRATKAARKRNRRR